MDANFPFYKSIKVNEEGLKHYRRTEIILFDENRGKSTSEQNYKFDL